MGRRGRHLLLLVLSAALSCSSTGPVPQELAPEIDPNDPLAPTLLMRQGQGLVAEGRVEEGLVRFRAALKLQPNNPTGHNLLGMAELQRGDAAKALEAFNRALAIVPFYTDARNNRGAAYAQLGQLALAEADFFAALGDLTYANRSGVYFNLGSLCLSRGNLQAAEESLRRAANPAGPVQAYVMLGRVEEQMGRLEPAETAYRAAMERAPERPEIPLALGKLLEGVARNDEARALFEKVIALAPDSPEAAQARALLGR